MQSLSYIMMREQALMNLTRCELSIKWRQDATKSKASLWCIPVCAGRNELHSKCMATLGGPGTTHGGPGKGDRPGTAGREGGDKGMV